MRMPQTGMKMPHDPMGIRMTDPAMKSQIIQGPGGGPPGYPRMRPGHVLDQPDTQYDQSNHSGPPHVPPQNQSTSTPSITKSQTRQAAASSQPTNASNQQVSQTSIEYPTVTREPTPNNEPHLTGENGQSKASETVGKSPENCTAQKKIANF